MVMLRITHQHHHHINIHLVDHQVSKLTFASASSHFPDIKPSIGEANWGLMGENRLQHDYRCVGVCPHV